MISNTLLHGVVAAIMCAFFFTIAWEMAHIHQEKQIENIITVLFALLGTVSGLCAFDWILAGL